MRKVGIFILASLLAVSIVGCGSESSVSGGDNSKAGLEKSSDLQATEIAEEEEEQKITYMYDVSLRAHVVLDDALLLVVVKNCLNTKGQVSLYIDDELAEKASFPETLDSSSAVDTNSVIFSLDSEEFTAVPRTLRVEMPTRI
jgi:hypothetical protein